MSDDLKLIEQLQKEMGIKLQRVPLKALGGGYNVNGFAADDNGRVRGLAIWEKKLRRLPELLSKFQRLESLALVGNQISDISGLNELKELTVLNLAVNQISDISSLNELKELTVLSLSSNQISDISSLNELKGLKELYLYNNQISDISSLNQLKNLKGLYLMNNKITHMPAEFLDLGLEIKWNYDRKDNGIYLYDNPLESPPVEIIKKGNEAVRQYFKSLEGEKQALNEVKVLLVGDGAAGKTSLVKRLLGKRFDKNESQTHGININTMEISQNNCKIKIHLWDFGGQEIMHATHQFFLSKRSLYILVLDGRKDEKTEYWLNHIKSFGGDSPVMVAMNKIDQNPGFDLNRRHLMEKYPNIKGFYPLSCKSGNGIDPLKKVLTNELARVELIRTTWPMSWFNVKNRLENMKEDFIDYETYRDICAGEKIDRDAMETLVAFLNDLGVILHFKEYLLEETQVLRPEWLTGAVYKIVTSKQLSAAKGLLNRSQLKEILTAENEGDHKYPESQYKYIIGMMKKFELCYTLENDRDILVPDLLEVGEPEIPFDSPLDLAHALKFLVSYNFLPPSVMPRLIVRLHRDIKNQLRWRSGVVLENRGFDALAVVKSDDREQTITIAVTGAQRREYLAVILNTLREINAGFDKLDVSEKVPLPDNPGIGVSYKHLIWLEQQNIQSYAVEDTQKHYDVRQLLGAVDKKVFNQLLTDVKNNFLSLEKMERQKRGYGLETFLGELFNLFGLAPRGSFRNTGEQIDGSFQLGNDSFLLEAKWINKQTATPDLVLFSDKVNSKPIWTRGLFVSISGFTGEAVEGFKLGRTTSIIGMDRQDLELILDGHISLDEAIRLELRHAGETNDFYAPLKELIALYKTNRT